MALNLLLTITPPATFQFGFPHRVDPMLASLPLIIIIWLGSSAHTCHCLELYPVCPVAEAMISRPTWLGFSTRTCREWFQDRSRRQGDASDLDPEACGAAAVNCSSRAGTYRGSDVGCATSGRCSCESLFRCDNEARSQGVCGIGETCAIAPQIIACGDTVRGDTRRYTNSGGSQSPEVFFNFRVEYFGEQHSFDACRSGFDTILRVYPADGFGARNMTSEIFTCDDCGDCGSRTRIVSGETQGFDHLPVGDYVIMLEGFRVASGLFTLSMDCEGTTTATTTPITTQATSAATTMTSTTTSTATSTGAPVLSPTLAPTVAYAAIRMVIPGIAYGALDANGIVDVKRAVQVALRRASQRLNQGRSSARWAQVAGLRVAGAARSQPDHWPRISVTAVFGAAATTVMHLIIPDIVLAGFEVTSVAQAAEALIQRGATALASAIQVGDTFVEPGPVDGSGASITISFAHGVTTAALADLGSEIVSSQQLVVGPRSGETTPTAFTVQSADGISLPAENDFAGLAFEIIKSPQVAFGSGAVVLDIETAETTTVPHTAEPSRSPTPVPTATPVAQPTFTQAPSIATVTHSTAATLEPESAVANMSTTMSGAVATARSSDNKGNAGAVVGVVFLAVTLLVGAAIYYKLGKATKEAATAGRRGSTMSTVMPGVEDIYGTPQLSGGSGRARPTRQPGAPQFSEGGYLQVGNDSVRPQPSSRSAAGAHMQRQFQATVPVSAARAQPAAYDEVLESRMMEEAAGWGFGAPSPQSEAMMMQEAARWSLGTPPPQPGEVVYAAFGRDAPASPHSPTVNSPVYATVNKSRPAPLQRSADRAHTWWAEGMSSSEVVDAVGAAGDGSFMLRESSRPEMVVVVIHGKDNVAQFQIKKTPDGWVNAGRIHSSLFALVTSMKAEGLVTATGEFYRATAPAPGGSIFPDEAPPRLAGSEEAGGIYEDPAQVESEHGAIEPGSLARMPTSSATPSGVSSWAPAPTSPATPTALYSTPQQSFGWRIEGNPDGVSGGVSGAGPSRVPDEAGLDDVPGRSISDGEEEDALPEATGAWWADPTVMRKSAISPAVLSGPHGAFVVRASSKNWRRKRVPAFAARPPPCCPLPL